MSDSIEVASQNWMSLWLAAIQARIDAALCDAAGACPDDALAIAATLDAQLERMRPEVAYIPATWLRTRLGLSRTEETAVWLLVASAASPAMRAMLRTLGRGEAEEPTVEVVQRVVYRAPGHALVAWRELGAEGRLAQLGLVVPAERERRMPDHRRGLQVTDRVRGLALGDTALAAELAHVARLSPDALRLDEVVVADGVIERARIHARSRRPFVVVVGGDGVGRTTLLRAALADAGTSAIEVEGAAWAKHPEELSAQLHVLVREALLLDRAMLVRGLDDVLAGDGGEARAAIIEQVLARSEVALFATARRRPASLRASRTIVMLELGPLTTPQRAALWARAIPGIASDETQLLASLYPLAPAVIHAVGCVLEARRPVIPSPELLRELIDEVVDARLTGLADRVSVTQAWEDLVLPPEQHNALVELVVRVRERSRVYETWGFGPKVGKGLGIAALFSGPPGTGKTMAAGLIANELGLPLYRVDLSQLVSKYIGETEKSLAALFDAAESTACVLLFDEADSLFGKRTEVKSSTDRYANLEVNYLLQRLETFTGICLLTTNHERAIDEAFTRRLTLHVRFSMPEEAERARLWASMLPPEAPVADSLELEELARRTALSGGHIRNAVLRSAFFAAHAGTPITMDHLWRATVIEYEASGKIAPAA